MIQDFIREIHHIGSDTPEKIAPPNTYSTLQKYGIAFTGISDAGRDYCMVRPSPRHGHMLVCLSGKGQVLLDETWEDCAEGQTYISPPRALMAFRTISGNRWKFAWIYFEGPRIQTPGALAIDHPVLTTANPYPLVNAIEGLYHEAVGAAESARIEQWVALLHTYLQRIVAPVQHTDPLWKLWSQVDASPATDWNLGKLATLAGMSDEALRRLSIRHNGRSPMQQVTFLRMQRADTLLQSTSAKLSVIAKHVGYDNVYAFSTAFTRCMGTPPSTRRHPHGAVTH